MAHDRPKPDSAHPARASALSPNLGDDPYVALTAPPAAVRPVAYRLRYALHAAVLAPSVHNTQPWRFRVCTEDEPYVELLMDASRELPALDPAHRQLVISCGAALQAFEIGLRACALEPQLELFPNGLDTPLIARVRVRDLRTADSPARQQLHLLLTRRSYRGAVTNQPIDPAVSQLLAQVVAPETAFDVVAPARWRAVEHLIVQAALELSETTGVDAEIRSWTRLDERTSDGIPAANWQRTSEQTAGAPVVQRDFAQGRPLPNGPAHPAVDGDPLLAVLLTPGDTPADWVATGAALLRLTLEAQSLGIALGYVNQPTEVPGLRDQLVELLEPTPEGYGVPQLVLRLGYPAQEPPPPTPRRPVRAVLIR